MLGGVVTTPQSKPSPKNIEFREGEGRGTLASQSIVANVELAAMGETFSPSFLNPIFSKHVSTVSCNTFPN